MTKSLLHVLSIHWGFSLGGVGKYAQLINNVDRYAPIKLTSLCILGKHWWFDNEGLDRINAKKIFINSRFDLSWVGKVIHEIDRLKPALILTHGFNGHFVALIAGLFTKAKPVPICSYHGSYHAITRNRKILEWIFDSITTNYIRHVALACVTVARYTKIMLTQKGVTPSKIEVVHNGLADQPAQLYSRKRLRCEWGVANNEVLIGTASRIDPIKGILFLVKAFETLQERYNNLKLLIIGSGTLEFEIHRAVNAKRISNRVIFTGYRSDIPACLEAMDIFILPSLAEYHSIALLEAMRARKPIVATSVGGNTESVRHMKEALIVPPADSGSLAQAIGRFLNEPSLAWMLGDAARDRFEKYFSEEIMVRNTAQWIFKCGKTAEFRHTP